MFIKNNRNCKPNFLGIGAAKAGTTTIAELLKEHPEIFIPKSKELHYFDFDYSLGEKNKDWYFSQFEENKAIGEFTPSYLFVPESPLAINKLLGEKTKFIVSLRNPIDRAYSHYWHAINNWGDEKYRELGYPIETLDFIEAIKAEPERLRKKEYHIRHLSYFSKGLYADQLKRYFSIFPKKNFYIIIFEEFIKRPVEILFEIYQFLKVDPKFAQSQKTVKLNSQTGSNKMDFLIREKLENMYKNSISELETLLGRKIDIWKSSKKI